MICLFLDTSSKDLVVSLSKDNEIVFNKTITTINDHSTYVVGTIREALESSNLECNDIDKIMVTVGPGSFTGTRIGVTNAKVLAWSLGINVIPISSLKQYVFGQHDYDYYVSIIEEKNDNLYYAIYNSNYDEISEEKYSNKDEMMRKISKLEGKILLISNNQYLGYDVRSKVINTIELIKYYSNEEGINPHKLKPNYIKKIEVESKL